MFRIYTPIDEVLRHVYLPLTEQLAYKFINGLALDKVFENKVHINASNSAHNLSSDENGNPILKDTRCTVDMTYNHNPLDVKWPTTNFHHALAQGVALQKHKDIRPTFYDIETQTILSEFEVPSTITLTFKMNFTDRVDAHKAANMIYTKYLNGDKIYVNDLLFNYPIPDEVIGQLYGFYKLKASDTTGFLDHLKRWSGDRIVTNVNRHDPTGKKEVVIRKNISQCVAQVEYGENVLSEEKEGDSVKSYQVEFSISLQFARTSHTMLAFPPVMMNKHLPAELIPVNPDIQFRKLLPAVHPYFSHDNFLKLLRNEQKPKEDRKEVYKLPIYDPWIVPANGATKKHKQREFLTAIVTLDNITDENATTTIDLTNPGLKLAPEIITLLQDLGPLALCFTSVLNVAVYANDTALEPSSLTLNNGTELIIPNRNGYPVYRLVISENEGVPDGVINRVRVIEYDVVAHRQ